VAWKTVLSSGRLAVGMASSLWLMGIPNQTANVPFCQESFRS
jgi:hypothetical protein